MKYMVMECNLSYAVVLSDQGDMLKVANLNYVVGQTVDSVFEMNEKPKSAFFETKVLAPVLAIAASFILLLSTFSMYQPSFATMIIDINPKVAVSINKDNIVTKLKSRNNDAKILIKDYDFKDKTLDTVTKELVERSIEKGFLHEGGMINLVFDSKNQEWLVETTAAMKTGLAESMSNRLNISFTITNSRNQNTNIVVPRDIENGLNNPDDSDYDDSDYDDSDYDDSDYDDHHDDNDDDDDDDDDSDYDDDNDDDNDDDDTNYED